MFYFQLTMVWAIFWSSSVGKKIADALLAVAELAALTIIFIGLFMVGLPMANYLNIPTTILVSGEYVGFLTVTYVTLKKRHDDNEIVIKGMSKALAILAFIANFQNHFGFSEAEAAIVSAEIAGLTAFNFLKSALFDKGLKKEAKPA